MVIGEEDEYFTAVKTRAPLCRYDALATGGVASRRLSGSP